MTLYNLIKNLFGKTYYLPLIPGNSLADNTLKLSDKIDFLKYNLLPLLNFSKKKKKKKKRGKIKFFI